jgi:hypothetical protein
MMVKTKITTDQHTGKTMAKKKSKADEALDKEISHVYAQACSGIQISIWDISKVFDVARKARAEGKDMTAAIVAFVETIRKN